MDHTAAFRLEPGAIVRALLDKQDPPKADPRDDIFIALGWLLKDQEWRSIANNQVSIGRVDDPFKSGRRIYYVCNERGEAVFQVEYRNRKVNYNTYTPGAWQQLLLDEYDRTRNPQEEPAAVGGTDGQGENDRVGADV